MSSRSPTLRTALNLLKPFSPPPRPPAFSISLSRHLTTTPPARSHENPLGLPRKETPKNPNLAARMQRGLPEKRRISGVRKVVAVSSAKGGVGKSTIAANLALAFARQGHRSGILDTDVFGPSIPTLFNLQDSGEPRLTSENKLVPPTNYGVRTMSMGYLIPPSAATVWRGLMVTKALQQLLHEVDWGGLDVLVLDLPPGTGDVQLTVGQQIVVDGAVLVSTPQTLSLSDCLRGLKMFNQTSIPVLGMVQNMSVFICPSCKTPHHIFSSGVEGAAEGGPESVLQACKRNNIDLLGDIPINGSICRDADRGKPSVVADPDGEASGSFMRIAKDIARRI